jgi:presenilin enhancer 2
LKRETNYTGGISDLNIMTTGCKRVAGPAMAPLAASGRRVGGKCSFQSSEVCTMDLRSPKVSPEQKVALCRTYFYLGFLGLPLLWGINAAVFYGEAYRKPAFRGQDTIRTLVKRSFLGCLLWTIVLVSWVIIFTTHRAAWGAMADYISFSIPVGTP